MLASLTGCRHEVSGLTPATQPLSPALLAPIEFENFSVMGPVTARGVDQLFTERVKLGSAEADAYEFLGHDAGARRVRTETVAAYLKARNAGAYPYTTFDLSMDSFFVRTAAALVFLQQAQPAQTNLLARRSLLDLPAAVVHLSGQSGSERAVKRGFRIRDGERAGAIRGIRRSGPNELTLTAGDRDYVLELVALGDFDRDGFQDGLLLVAAYHREGSSRSFEVYLVSQTNADDEVIQLKEFQFWH